MNLVQRIVVSAFLCREGSVLLAQRTENKRIAPGKWHLPGGHVEHGEHPKLALMRELEEEFAVKTDIGHPIDTFSYLWEGNHTVGIVYAAWLTDPNAVLVWRDDEFQACAWVREKDILNYLPCDDHNYFAAMEGFRKQHGKLAAPRHTGKSGRTGRMFT